MSEKSVADKLRACTDDDHTSFRRICGYEPEGSSYDKAIAMFHASGTWSLLKSIAHEIDAEEAEMRGFCERVEEAAKNREDLDVFGTEYMPLPLDKNGEPWHVGDRMFVPRDGVCKVSAVGKFGVIAVGREGGYWYSANSYSHYNKPAVEDVLRNLLIEECGDSSPDDETIAKYAAKLRLKENR